MAQSKRSGRLVVHERLIYVGSLDGLSASARASLVLCMERLLMGRAWTEPEDRQVRDLAVELAGKIHSRRRGHSRAGQRVLSVGGPLGQGGEERIDLSSFRQVQAREVGAEWLCWQAAERLGIGAFLRGRCGWSAAQTEVLLMNLIGRLCYPSSELKTEAWLAEQSGAPGLMGTCAKLHDEALGCAARALLEVHHGLEAYLYARVEAELGPGSKVLYDLTNTYFEGRMQGSSLAQFGRSKEMRSDCRLVSIGLQSDERGFIRRSDFYAGNVSEPDTFAQVLENAKGCGGVLTDAGIGTAGNIAEAALAGVPYMCVARESFAHLEPDFSKAEAFTHQPSDGQRPYRVWALMEEHSFQAGGRSFTDRLIFVKSEAKKDKEDAIVEKQRKRMEEALEKIRGSLGNPRARTQSDKVQQRIGRLRERNPAVSKAFDISAEDDGARVCRLEWSYDPSRAQRRNGVYVIRTDLPVKTAREAWQAYHTLTAIEEVNRCCKTDLAMRPVYHHKDETIQAHLLLTLVACTVASFLRHLLAEKGIRWSWREIVRVMNTQKAVLSEFRNTDGELFIVSNWTEPEQKAASIYQAAGFDPVRGPGFFFKISPRGS